MSAQAKPLNGLSPLLHSILIVLAGGEAMSNEQIKSELSKLGWARITDEQIETALEELFDQGMIDNE